MQEPNTLQVGSIVVAKRHTAVCDVGEVGVCYECYSIADRPGWSFIFQQGRYDGFSPDEVEMILHVTGQVCTAVADYQFLNVMRVTRDYQEGYFNPAFVMVTAAPMPPKPM